MAVGDAHVFPGFLTPVPTQNFFLKSPTTFLTCFSRGERQKYARKKFRLNQVSNSQPPGHESNKLTTEPPGWGYFFKVVCCKFVTGGNAVTLQQATQFQRPWSGMLLITLWESNFLLYHNVYEHWL